MPARCFEYLNSDRMTLSNRTGTLQWGSDDKNERNGDKNRKKKVDKKKQGEEEKGIVGEQRLHQMCVRTREGRSI